MRQDKGLYVYPMADKDIPSDQPGITRLDLGALEIAAAMAAAVRSCGESPDAGQIAEFSYKLSAALIAQGKKMEASEFSVSTHKNVPIPVGYISPYQGDKIPDGWIKADGRLIGKSEPETKALYILLWENSEKMKNQISFKKGASAAGDFEAGREIPIPNLMETGQAVHDGKYKTLIKL